MDNYKIKIYLTEIVALSAGWDDDGSTGPKEPFCWETIARVAMDYARAALKEIDGDECPNCECQLPDGCGGAFINEMECRLNKS